MFSILLARIGIKSHKAPAESATRVLRAGRGGFFPGRNRHIKLSFIKHGSAVHMGKRVLIDARLPEQIARLRVHCIDIGFHVGKICRRSCRGLPARWNNIFSGP